MVTDMLEEVKIEKLVHGGQGLGVLPDGRKVFVWKALPDETVKVRIIKKRRDYAEAVAEEIIIASPERIEPVEENFLATSPWQILSYDAENRHKKAITQELFDREKVVIPDFDLVAPTEIFHYRNKMEYSFWGDDDGMHLALYQRGSHQKHIVTGSMLAIPALDTAANAIVAQLSTLHTRAGDLKSLIVRCNQKGEVAASLFVKIEKFKELELPAELKGLRVYYSNPKSPASVPTKLLYELGTVLLRDKLLDKEFIYDVDSFFQVNVPIFEKALRRMGEFVPAGELVDMYAGVGTIGLSLGSKKVTLVELDVATAAMAAENAGQSELLTEVIETSTEKALDYIVTDTPIVFDPPRAGLHPKVTDRLLEVQPPLLIYLSCNPATQARDLARLQEVYDITFFEAYNFFPRTPHIESLIIMKRK